MPNLTAVILSRSASNLGPCVSAIRRHDPGVDILVVDDGITESEWLALTEQWGVNWGPAYARPLTTDEPPWLRVISGKPTHLWHPADWTSDPYRPFLTRIDGVRPFIFSRNANLGLMYANRIDADQYSPTFGQYLATDDIILTNDDAILTTPRGFSIMQEQSDFWWPRLGLIGSTCNNVGNISQHPLPTPVPPGTPVTSPLAFRDEPRVVCFVCVLIPRSTIELVGLLDETFVNYGMDDDDYSLRVRNAGLGIGISDLCYVDHGSLKSEYRGGATTGGDFRPNLKLFIQKWGVDNRGLGKTESPWRELFE